MVELVNPILIIPPAVSLPPTIDGIFMNEQQGLSLSCFYIHRAGMVT